MESSKIKIVLLMRGNIGKDVAGLKKALRKALGEGAAAYPGIATGNEFDADTETALEISRLKDRLTVHHEEKILTRRGNGADMKEKTASASHGGFDNNVEIISKTLERITGTQLALPVDDLVGF